MTSFMGLYSIRISKESQANWTVLLSSLSLEILLQGGSVIRYGDIYEYCSNGQLRPACLPRKDTKDRWLTWDALKQPRTSSSMHWLTRQLVHLYHMRSHHLLSSSYTAAFLGQPSYLACKLAPTHSWIAWSNFSRGLHTRLLGCHILPLQKLWCLWKLHFAGKVLLSSCCSNNVCTINVPSICMRYIYWLCIYRSGTRTYTKVAKMVLINHDRVKILNVGQVQLGEKQKPRSNLIGNHFRLRMYNLARKVWSPS